MENRTDINDFDRLYHDYRQRYIRFARTYVRDTATAEDIVMDSLMYYWENRSALPHQINIPAYVLTIVKNRCINHLRREQKHQEVKRMLSEHKDWELNVRISTLEACNPEQLFSEEIQTIIQRTLDSLPEQSRHIFIRSKYERLSHREIADDLGLSVKSIEYHITKTLKILRQALKDYFPAWLALLGI